MKIKDFLRNNKDLFINFLVALLTSVCKIQEDKQINDK